MSWERERFARQQRLREVGESGQRRIVALPARVHAHPGAGVEIAYLERAGVARLAADVSAPAIPFDHAGTFHHAVTRALAEGAWRALTQLRAALEMEPR